MCLNQERTEIIIWTGKAEAPFNFDNQQESETQDEEMASRMVRRSLTETNRSVQVSRMLAYCQTGSGKTYAMFGQIDDRHLGMTPRMFQHMFEGLATREVSMRDRNTESGLSLGLACLFRNGRWSQDTAANLSFTKLDLFDLADSKRQKSLSYVVGNHFQGISEGYQALTPFSSVTNTLVDVAPRKLKYILHSDSSMNFFPEESFGRNHKSQIRLNLSRSICSSPKNLDDLQFSQEEKLLTNKAMLGETDEEKADDLFELALEDTIQLPTEQVSSLTVEKGEGESSGEKVEGEIEQPSHLVHQTDDASQVESMQASTVMKYAEEILGLQLELYVWSLIREETIGFEEAIHELKEAKPVIEESSAEMEDLKKRNGHYSTLLKEKDLQVCGPKDQVEELTACFSRVLEAEKEKFDSVNKQFNAATLELKRIKSVNEALESQRSAAVYEMEDLRKSNLNYLKLLVDKDAEINALKKKLSRKEIINLCEEEQEAQIACSELLAQNQELVETLNLKDDELKQRSDLIDGLKMTIAQKDAKIDTIVSAVHYIQSTLSKAQSLSAESYKCIA